LLDLGEGVQKFSCHYEADLDRGGASVLDIRPLLWSDGWPVAGENVKEGTYEIQSLRVGNSLELAVEGVPVGGGRRGGRDSAGGFGGRRGGAPGDTNTVAGPAAFTGSNAPAAAPPGVASRRGGGGGAFGGRGGVIPPQDVAQVSTNWPAGNIDLRLSNYMDQAQQKWAITAFTNAGGYPGSPYFKITIAGTDRALAATPDMELVTVPVFTGDPEQLWRFDELADGSWRIMPKALPGTRELAALAAVGSGFATLSEFEPESDKYRWVLKAP
jgi:arabinan endo-1,5-alpha-L-arabinosidase